MKKRSTIPMKKEIDQKSYERLEKQLEELKQELSEIRTQLTALRTYDGSNLAESPSYIHLTTQENGILSRIELLKQEINSFVVVEKDSTNSLITLGDYVTLEIKYSDEPDIEITKYLLVGSSPDAFKNEISQNSAIGKAIMGKAVGAYEKISLPNGITAEIKIIAKE